MTARPLTQRHDRRSARVLVGAGSDTIGAQVADVVRRAGFEVCARVKDADAAITEAREHEPDALVLDADLPGSALHATAELRSSPEIAVILVRAPDDDDALFEALRVGAIGYLPDDFDLESLPRVLDAVFEGEIALPRAFMTRVARELITFLHAEQRRADHVLAPLSSRQWQVLQLMAAGMTTNEIASALYVSKVTVRTHISAIVKKLGVPDRASAVRYLQGVEANQRRDIWTIETDAV